MVEAEQYTQIEDLILFSITEEDLDAHSQQKLNEWRAASPQNEKYYQDTKVLWFSTLSTDDTHRYDKEEAFKNFKKRICLKQDKLEKVTRFHIPRIFYRVAAVAVLLIVSYLSYWQGGQQIKNQFADVVIEVPLGSKTKLYLPDSTLVWLNAGSRITYSQGFGVYDRNLQLNGEAYFEVTKNKELPFGIFTKELYVTVLGTKFNLRNYEEDEEVTVNLLEGKVSLDNQLKEMPLAYLEEKEKVILNKRTGLMTFSSCKNSNSKEWTNDNLLFDEELLIDIIKELKRNYNVKIQIENESLKTHRFYGNFVRRDQSIREILDMITSTGRLNYRIEGDTYILY